MIPQSAALTVDTAAVWRARLANTLVLAEAHHEGLAEIEASHDADLPTCVTLNGGLAHHNHNIIVKLRIVNITRAQPRKFLL